jgi:predicted Zn-ribbon and HTH transcriptional regulator
MEPLVELLIYVNCICADCGHKWESEILVKSCPKCNNDNISQAAMMRGL